MVWSRAVQGGCPQPEHHVWHDAALCDAGTSAQALASLKCHAGPLQLGFLPPVFFQLLKSAPEKRAQRSQFDLLNFIFSFSPIRKHPFFFP